MDEMTDKPKRPTLRLKFPPKLPDPPTAEPAPAAHWASPKAPSAPWSSPKTPAAHWSAPKPPARAAAPSPEWKCKPCGTAFNVPAELGDDDSVRCPSCNARLGLARDFRQDPPNTSKLRARAVAPAPVGKR